MRKIIIALFLVILIAPPCFAAQSFVKGESSQKFYFFLIDEDNAIATGEAGGQPQISINGASSANTSGTLTHVDNGLYYITLIAGEVGALGEIIVRYKSANTAEFKDIGAVELIDVAIVVANLKQMIFKLTQEIDFLREKVELIEENTEKAKEQVETKPESW